MKDNSTATNAIVKDFEYPMKQLIILFSFAFFASMVYPCLAQDEKNEVKPHDNQPEIKAELTEHDKQILRLRIQRIQEKDQQFRTYRAFGTTDDDEISRLKKLDGPQQLKAMSENKGRLSKEVSQLLLQLQLKNDGENLEEFVDVVKTYGYPSPQRLGVETDRLFVILLHPPIEKTEIESHIERMSDLLKPEVLAGRMKPGSFATFVDNMLGKILRKPQLYGTNEMFSRELGKILPPLIESLESANSARREIGLPELKEGEYRLPDDSSKEIGPLNQIYKLFPVETEVQAKLLWPEGNAPKAYLVVELTAFAGMDGAARAQLFEQIDKSLEKIASDAGPLYVRRVYFPLTDTVTRDTFSATNKMVVAKLKELGGRHFEKAIFPSIGEVETGYMKWVERVSGTEETLKPESEAITTKNWATVTPALTPLTRLLLDGADCLIEIDEVLQQKHGFHTDNQLQAATKILDSIEFPRKELLRIDHAGLVVNQGWKDQLSASSANFAKELGFEQVSIQYAPDKIQRIESLALVGKTAPDFSLEHLQSGKQIRLSEFIAGRPAVISFWGITCGPCIKEAAHLNKLHNAFHDKSLRVVAVNGYNDSRESISKLFEKEDWHHHVMLNGKSVAEQKYFVETYPVTFLVDHRGNITKRIFGFDPELSEQFEKDVANLVSKVTQLEDRSDNR